MNYNTKLGLLVAFYAISGAMIGSCIGWLAVRLLAVYGG